MLRLQLLQLLHQSIVFGVTDARIIQHVVAVIMRGELLAQCRDARRGQPGALRTRGLVLHGEAAAAELRKTAVRAGLKGCPLSSCNVPRRRCASTCAHTSSSLTASGPGTGPGR